MRTARILIVAGSDSGGGAGIQADIETVTMLGGHAMTAITALTAQNTLGVQAAMPVPTEMVLAQIASVVDDIGVDAVKIGMIGAAETAHAVADYLSSPSFERTSSRHARGPAARPESPEQAPEPGPRFGGGDGRVPIVFDPVMVATSGSLLADDATVAAFARLMRIATLTTPNLPELAALGGEAAVRATGCALLVKGGHGDGADLTDRLIVPDGSETRWTAPRIDTRHTHGTGCTLSSAIATGLAQGLSLAEAVARARLFVRIALREAPGLGAGHGPMGHQAVRLDVDLGAPRLNQVTLPIGESPDTAAFYEALGLTRLVDALPRYARFESAGGVTLSIEAADEIDGRPILYVECGDLDAAMARLRACGTAVDAPVDQRWGWREARCTDPAGNAICLYQAGEMRRFPPWRLQH